MWHNEKYDRIMKYNIILVVLVLISLSACGNHKNSKTNEKVEKEKINLIDSASKVENEKIEIDDKISIWIYDCMVDTIIQARKVDKDTLTSEKMINIINSKYQDEVILDFVNISNDTIFVKIDNSEYLTQQMGTAGADEYMISATFTLTELPKIKFVNFDFEYGDHASPGTYNRKYYLDWIKENKELNE